MTKKKIGVLNGKPVIQGDPNLITKNEILYKNDNNTIQLQERQGNELKSLTNSSSEDEENEYYEYNQVGSSESEVAVMFVLTNIGESVVSYILDGVCIAPYLPGSTNPNTASYVYGKPCFCFEFSTKQRFSNIIEYKQSSCEYKAGNIPAGSLFDKISYMDALYETEEEFLQKANLRKISKEEYMAKIDHYYDSTIDNLIVS